MTSRVSSTSNGRPLCRPGTGAGFTLVEVLLVLAIIGIVTAATVPVFVRSIQGNRLRTAARTVVMAGRYARSMAVLRQQNMQLVLNIGSDRVSVKALATQQPQGEPRDELDVDALFDAEGGYGASDGSVWSGSGQESATNAPAGTTELVQALDRVRIDFVEFPDEDERVTEGTCTVMYYNNGTCRPYRVQITDEDKASILIEVDALSSASTEHVE